MPTTHGLLAPTPDASPVPPNSDSAHPSLKPAPVRAFLPAKVLTDPLSIHVAPLQVPISKWLLQEQEQEARLAALQQQLRELEEEDANPHAHAQGAAGAADDRIFSDDEDEGPLGGPAGGSGPLARAGSAGLGVKEEPDEAGARGGGAGEKRTGWSQKGFRKSRGRAWVQTGGSNRTSTFRFGAGCC